MKSAILAIALVALAVVALPGAQAADGSESCVVSKETVAVCFIYDGWRNCQRYYVLGDEIEEMYSCL